MEPRKLCLWYLVQLNRHLSQFIDEREAEESVAELPAFLLQVSSPGLSSQLRSEKDFTAFKGFPVTVTTTEVRSLLILAAAAAIARC